MIREASTSGVNIRALRKAALRALPAGLRGAAVNAARHVDYLTGLPRAHARPGAVMMLHVGRCGSTVLGNMLDQHNRIYWDGELYHVAWAQAGFQPISRDWRRWTRRQLVMSGSMFYGFEVKALSDQHLALIGMTLAELLAMAREIGVTHFIILERRNYLRRMISQYVGLQTKVRHLEPGAKARLNRVRLDVERCGFGGPFPDRPLLDCLRDIAGAYARMRELTVGDPTLELVYETDIDASGPAVAYEAVCRFLDLSPASVEVENSKTNPYPVCELVENFDELERHLAGSEFEWMLRA